MDGAGRVAPGGEEDGWTRTDRVKTRS
jgi:hypothetical protein